MKFTVYKTICLPTGKYYIGKHQTEDPNDDYLGSGKILQRAINKYGKENFRKDVLFIFETEEEMNEKEAELVDPRDPKSMNLCPGGQGGFGYINKNRFQHTSEAIKKRMASRSKNINWLKSVREIGRKQLKKIEHIRKRVLKEKYPNGVWYGKTHTQESKDKIGKANSEKQRGSNNSQFGSIWITNGKENRKIKKDENIPIGWNKGRKLLA